MKILASDFDGTLYVNNEISEKNKKAIKKLQDAGHLFGLCTGRPLMGVEKFAEGVQFDFYILSTGAVVLNKDKEDIKRATYAIEVADRIAEIAYLEAIVMILYDYKMHFYKQIGKKKAGDIIPVVVVDSFKELGIETIETMSILCNKEDKAREMAAIINDKYGDVCSAHQNIDAVDIVPKNCSKATGLHNLQEYYRLQDEDIYVIGDSYNDIVMFEASKHSFSFPYAPKEVSDKAERIVEDIAEAITIMLDE